MRVIDSHLIEPYTQIIDRISSCQKFLNAGENFIARAGASRFSIIQCSLHRNICYWQVILALVYLFMKTSFFIGIIKRKQSRNSQIHTQKCVEYIISINLNAAMMFSIQNIHTQSETLISNKYLLLFFFLILIKQPRRPISFPTRLFW